MVQWSIHVQWINGQSMSTVSIVNPYPMVQWSIHVQWFNGQSMSNGTMANPCPMVQWSIHVQWFNGQSISNASMVNPCPILQWSIYIFIGLNFIIRIQTQSYSIQTTVKKKYTLVSMERNTMPRCVF